MFRLLMRCALVFACLLPAMVFAQQQTTKTIDVPAGNLVTALDVLARQTGVQFVYSTTQLSGLHTDGVHGQMRAQQALEKLLDGTGYVAHRDASGAIVIVKGAATPPAQASPPQSSANSKQDAAAQKHAQTLSKVVVLGSRIPRTKLEGPSPVHTITAQQIQARGLTSVPKIMRSLTENIGQLTNDQYTNGFTPAARAVDLRGMGPNHTLVLINGHRIADYPQAYGGSSNFTDISNIPIGMIEKVEVLTGSASAIYGSDAIAGVVNFVLKKKADGTSISYRASQAQHHGYSSHMIDFSTGFSVGKLSVLVGGDLYDREPLWAFQRSYTDSRRDSPAYDPADPTSVVADNMFYYADSDGYYYDPGKATCQNLSHLQDGSVFYAERPRYGHDPDKYVPGYYCGSNDYVKYGTLKNRHRMVNLYLSGHYAINSYTKLNLNVLYNFEHEDGYNSLLKWYYCEPKPGIGECEDSAFYNDYTGRYEQWGRIFTIGESGGVHNGEIRNIQHAISTNLSLQGWFGPDSDWAYDANYSHSQNDVVERWPAVIAAKANAFFLGPRLGTGSSSGLGIYDANPNRLFTPLTIAQFNSITTNSTDHDSSRAQDWQFTLTNDNLFDLPGGAAGFAAVAEYGKKFFAQRADPRSLDGELYGLHNTTAVGSRNHWAAGVELKLPVLSTLTLDPAGRYDSYSYGKGSSSKFTYSLGLEYRPFRSLLLRASMSTGFRAPDLNYLYEGLSGSSSSGVDYYRCRRDEPGTRDTPPGDFYWCDYYPSSYNGRSHGSMSLKDETSKSWTYGVVWAPSHNFNVRADYYHIELNNEVEFQSSRDVLRREADCRLGQDINGQAVDGSSTFCQQIESQVTRNPVNAVVEPEKITAVLVLPINVATDQTSGVDFRLFYRVPTRHIGIFHFRLGATYVDEHTIQLDPSLPVTNEFTDMYYYLIPRSRADGSVTWYLNNFNTSLYVSRTSGLPNYPGTKRLSPTYRANLSLGYDFGKHFRISLAVDNLFDSRPQRDQTWTSYPYYDRAWFSPVGREYYLRMKMHFGGS